jgi:hypothetical protein
MWEGLRHILIHNSVRGIEDFKLLWHEDAGKPWNITTSAVTLHRDRNLPISTEQRPPWKASSCSATREMPWKFITMFTRACLSQIGPGSILSTYFIKIHFIIIPSIPRSSKRSFIQVFLPKLCMYFSSLLCMLHTPPSDPRLDHCNIWWRVENHTVISFLFGPNIPLSSVLEHFQSKFNP